jgi:hypothetical protein
MVMATFRLGKLTLPRMFGKTRHGAVSATLVIVPQSRANRKEPNYFLFAGIRELAQHWQRLSLFSQLIELNRLAQHGNCFGDRPDK